MITRRDASRLVLGGTLAALLPMPSIAQSQAERERILGLWRARLEAEMNNALAVQCRGHFTVLDFRYVPGSGTLEMASVIQLDWPPGLRRRPFQRQGSDAEATYVAMRGEALAYYGNATCVA